MARGDAPLTWSDTQGIRWKVDGARAGLLVPGRLGRSDLPDDGRADRRGGRAGAAGRAPLRRPLLRPQDRQAAVGARREDRHAARARASHLRQLRVELADHRRQARLRLLRLARAPRLHDRWAAGVAEGLRPPADVHDVRRGRMDLARGRHAARRPRSRRRVFLVALDKATGRNSGGRRGRATRTGRARTSPRSTAASR